MREKIIRKNINKKVPVESGCDTKKPYYFLKSSVSVALTLMLMGPAVSVSQEQNISVRNTMAKMASKDEITPPKEVSASDFIELFEKLSGAYPGFRRAHARGVCAEGEFITNNEAKYFSQSELLSNESVPATIRFSLGGGNPNADERVPGVRGIGVQLTLPSGQKHNFTGNNTPVFAGKDPQTFFGLLKTFLPDETGKPNISKTSAYIMANPSTRANATWSATTLAPISFANTKYFGLHTFFYEGSAQIKFRWTLVPSLGEKQLSKEQAASMPSEFLAEKLQQQVEDPNTEVKFTLVANIGKESDTNIDPSQQWPEDREQITLGELIIHSSGSDSCTPVNFDPNVMSAGFSPSEDPVLRMRSPAYGISFGKRLSNQ